MTLLSKTACPVTSTIITCASAQLIIPPVTPPTSLQCCNSVVPSSNFIAQQVAELLGLDILSLNVDVGLRCDPVTLVGIPCGGTVVVCDAPEQEWGGLLAINYILLTL
ncbi:hypothetical protein DFH09DRAFT_1342074 [Mycena vulgaris]|nr:hypothetical protein DFH09DRAFT_1342074 [Mycena vulgaris]